MKVIFRFITIMKAYPKHTFTWVAAVVVTFMVVGCTSHQAISPSVVPPDAPDVSVAAQSASLSAGVEKKKMYTEFGKATFYAKKHQNTQTASGELYNHNLKTAAHRELPFGAMVKVTNMANGKSVVVKINDRCACHKTRIIDLSRSAFTSISSLSAGLLDVTIEVLK